MAEVNYFAKSLFSLAFVILLVFLCKIMLTKFTNYARLNRQISQTFPSPAATYRAQRAQNKKVSWLSYIIEKISFVSAKNAHEPPPEISLLYHQALLPKISVMGIEISHFSPVLPAFSPYHRDTPIEERSEQDSSSFASNTPSYTPNHSAPETNYKHRMEGMDHAPNFKPASARIKDDQQDPAVATSINSAVQIERHRYIILITGDNTVILDKQIIPQNIADYKKTELK